MKILLFDLLGLRRVSLFAKSNQRQTEQRAVRHTQSHTNENQSTPTPKLAGDKHE